MNTVDLAAGPVRLLYEPLSGWVRYLSVGGVEVVRAIYGAVRDRNWGTVRPAVEDTSIESHADRFRVTFRAVCRDGPIDFRWAAEVTGEEDGTVTYRFRGRAESSFLRNRIGLCVLHPLRRLRHLGCIVTHTDGTTTTSPFPALVAPYQPFKDIRAMRYRVAGAPEIEVSFAGEVFETEDQRNWIDGSYKTYGTPLALPLPVEVRPGDEVEQAVTFRVSPGAWPGLPPRPAVPTLVRMPARPLPELRWAAPPDPARAPDPYFAELNRNRPPADSAGEVQYAMNPQVHATDDRSIVECLEGIADTVATARSFLPPAARLIVGPITLRPRFMPNPAGDGYRVAGPDPREQLPFGAAWTVGCVTELLRGGAEVAEFFGPPGPDPSAAERMIAALAGKAGWPAAVLDCDEPLTAGGLVCDGVAWVANSTDRPQRVRLEGNGGRLLELAPYSVVTLDLAETPG